MTSESNGSIHVLGIDPSIRCLGMILAEIRFHQGTDPEIRILEHRAVKPRAPKDFRLKSEAEAARMFAVAHELNTAVHSWKPELIVSELPGGAQSHKAATSLSAAKALVVATSCFSGLQVAWVTPQRLKAAVGGKLTSSKEAVQKGGCRRVSGLKEVLKSLKTDDDKEAIGDAAAAVVAFTMDPAYQHTMALLTLSRKAAGSPQQAAPAQESHPQAHQETKPATEA